MPNGRVLAWAHHQRGHAGTHGIRIWLEKRNMYIPTTYLPFQIKK